MEEAWVEPKASVPKALTTWVGTAGGRKHKIAIEDTSRGACGMFRAYHTSQSRGWRDVLRLPPGESSHMGKSLLSLLPLAQG